ncbi:MAG: glycosyl hydrolase [Deltaproteobacteria bacterium]|nr:glycosyl hydrolase [Deltaproteobacteria bacterium]
MAVCLSPNGTTLFVSHQRAQEVLVGTVRGVATIGRVSDNRWEVVRESLTDCHIGSLMIEPASGLVFAGAHGGTLYASSDLGKTWTPRNKGITHDHIYCLSYAQVAGKAVLYAGTEPAHLYRSDDLGESWHEIPGIRNVPSVAKWTFPAPPHIGHVKNIAFDPSDARTVYVSIEQGGLLRSCDGGTSWSELQGFHDDVHRLAVKQSDPKCLYMANGDGLFHSRDGGANWAQLTTRSMRIGYPDGLVIHPEREDLMFMSGGIDAPSKWRANRTANSRIARSRDGAKTWEMLEHGLPEHLRANTEALMMEVWDRSFALFVGTTDGEIYYSDDEGDHWSKIISGLAPVSKGRHYRNLNEVAA